MDGKDRSILNTGNTVQKKYEIVHFLTHNRLLTPESIGVLLRHEHIEADAVWTKRGDACDLAGR